jgi:hypothetical protein
MENTKMAELQNKIWEGVKWAAEQTLEEKKKKNQQMAISVNGEVKIVNARDI